MGLFSVHLHPEHGPARAAHRDETRSVRLREAARAAIRNTRSEIRAALREVRLAAVAARFNGVIGTDRNFELFLVISVHVAEIQTERPVPVAGPSFEGGSDVHAASILNLRV